MPETPQKMLPESHKKKTLLLRAGGGGLRKKLLVTAGVLVAMFLLADGVYWLTHRSSNTDEDASTVLLSKYNKAAPDRNALPAASGPNATDDKSLQQDL